MHLTAWIHRLRLKMMKMCIVRWKKEKAPTTKLVNRLHKNENLFWNFKNSFSKNSIFVVNILVAYQLGEKSSFCSVLSYRSPVGRRHQFGKSCIFCDINWIFFYFNFTVFLLHNKSNNFYFTILEIYRINPGQICRFFMTLQTSRLYWLSSATFL